MFYLKKIPFNFDGYFIISLTLYLNIRLQLEEGFLIFMFLSKMRLFELPFDTGFCKIYPVDTNRWTVYVRYQFGIDSFILHDIMAIPCFVNTYFDWTTPSVLMLTFRLYFILGKPQFLASFLIVILGACYYKNDAHSGISWTSHVCMFLLPQTVIPLLPVSSIITRTA